MHKYEWVLDSKHRIQFSLNTVFIWFYFIFNFLSWKKWSFWTLHSAWYEKHNTNLYWRKRKLQTRKKIVVFDCVTLSMFSLFLNGMRICLMMQNRVYPSCSWILSFMRFSLPVSSLLRECILNITILNIFLLFSKITHQNQYQNRTYIRQSYKLKLDNTFKSIFLTKMKRVTTNRWEGERHDHKTIYFRKNPFQQNKTKQNNTKKFE